jgi:NAD(P)-dependent dehydrogenase (short-subunit alcohol dehydrogenase family)
MKYEKALPARDHQCFIKVSPVVGFHFNDPESRKFYFSIKSYGRSKLANILFTRHLAEMLREDGITVNCLASRDWWQPICFVDLPLYGYWPAPL